MNDPSPVIDPTTFAELQDSAGPEFVQELLQTFFEEAPLILAELRAARAEGSAERYRRAAHSLKSNAMTFGALTFGARARAIETSGLTADAAADIAALDALDAAYATAAAALQEMARG